MSNKHLTNLTFSLPLLFPESSAVMSPCHAHHGVVVGGQDEQEHQQHHHVL